MVNAISSHGSIALIGVSFSAMVSSIETQSVQEQTQKTFNSQLMCLAMFQKKISLKHSEQATPQESMHLEIQIQNIQPIGSKMVLTKEF
jgi:hypothetical protein